MANNEYLTDYDQIVNTIQMYIAGSKQGKSEVTLLRAESQLGSLSACYIQR